MELIRGTYSLQYNFLRGQDTLGGFSTIFHKGDIYDFHFAFLHMKPHLDRDLLYRKKSSS